MLAYRCFGHRHKPPLVMLHGFLGNKDDWQPLAPLLADHFYGVCIDLPCHGDSPNTSIAFPGLNPVAKLIAKTLKQLHIVNYHLLGYSLGGRIALHLARLNPEQIISLTLESCHHGLGSAQARRTRWQKDRLWHERLRSLSIEKFIDLWYRQKLFAPLDETIRAMLVNRRRQNSTALLQNIYLPTSLAMQRDLSNLPNKLSFDWHYFVGQEDTKFTALAENWSQHTKIKLHRFAKAGHNIHLVQKDTFCQTLIRLLSEDIQ